MMKRIRNKIIIVNVLLSLLAGFFLNFAFSSAQSPRQIHFSAYLVNNENKEITNGEYDVRFAFYSQDRQAIDPYPSATDPRIWEETQKVYITDGFIVAYLGLVNPLPTSLNFTANNYYLGIRIGTDSEMIPRKRVGAVPLAIDSFNVQGRVPGSAAGNLVILGAGGKVDIGNLPTGTSGKKLLMAQDIPEGEITVSGSYDYLSASGMEITLDQIDLGTDVIGTLPIARGGTGLAAYVAGDMLYSQTGAALNRLAIGAAGNVLTVAGGLPTWAPAAGVAHNLLSALHSDATVGAAVRGDIITGQGVAPTWTRLALGGNGTILRSDGTDVTWSTATYPGTTTVNQILYSSLANTVTGLATANYGVLATSAAGVPSITGTPTIQNMTLGYNGADGSLVIFSDEVVAGPDQTVTINPHANMTQDVVYTLPADDGGVNEVLMSDGSGNLSWSATAAAVPHNLLSATHSDATVGAAVRGDIITGQGVAPTWTRLALGGNGTILRSDGTDVTWSTATYPGTTTVNQILYSSLANTVTGLATANYGVLATSAAGVPSITGTPTIQNMTLGYNGTNGQLIIFSEQVGGDHTITFNTHAAMTQDVVYTFPADDGNPTEGLTTDGAGNLSWSAVAAAPHVFLSATHSDTTAGVATRGDLITGQGVAPKWTRLALGGNGTILRSDGTDVTWSTATYPGTTTVNQLLYSSAGDVVSGLATAASGLLVTSAGGVPSIAVDIPTAVTIGGTYIYRVGGNDVSLADGGTGASLADPNDDRIMFWDDTAGAVTWLDLGTTLAITATTFDVAADSIGDTQLAFNTGQHLTTASTPTFQTLNLGYNGADGSLVIFSDETVAGPDQTVTFNPHANMTQDVVYTLPADDGDNTNVLVTDGAGNLSWSATAPAGAHAFLSATHSDTTVGAAVRGDIITGQGVAPTWTRLALGGNGTILRSDGTDVTWSTATYPGTTTVNQILYSSLANTVTGLATANYGVLATSAAGVPSITGTPTIQNMTLGYNTQDGSLVIFSDETVAGVDQTVTFNPHANMTQDVVYTLPADDGGVNEVLMSDGSGNLSWSATAAAVPHNLLSATHSDATVGAAVRGDIITGQGVAPTWTRLALGGNGTILRSDGTDVTWSTATYPGTTTVNQILYSSLANTVTGLATANYGVLATSAAGVPSITGTPTISSMTLGYNTQDGSLVIFSDETVAGVDQTVTFNPHANMTQDVVYTLPADDGGVNEVLMSDGSGNLSWSATAAAVPHNLLSATHSDATVGAAVRGDIITGQGVAPKWTRLSIGGAGSVLSSDGTDVSWSALSAIDHGSLGGLLHDDHTQYALLAGRAGGQILYGGDAANDDLTLEGTSHGTRTTSYVLLQPDGGNVGIGTSTPTSRLHVVGSNSVATVGIVDLLTADGTFATNNGWTEGAGWTIAGGVATHATGNTATLEGTSNATDNSKVYKITFTVAVTTAGDGFTVSLGGADSGTTYGGLSLTHTAYIMPNDASGTLVFTPGAAGTFVGTIDNVTIYEVIGSTPDTVIVNSDGTDSKLEIRAGGSGNGNIFIGESAGMLNTTGFDNTAVGSFTLYANATGQQNTALGYYALSYNISGSGNVAVGDSALNVNTSGENNTAVGSSTLYSNTTGGWNTAIGNSALNDNESGYYNSALGFSALSSNYTGSNNTALGYGAFSSNSTGSGNVALGYFAGAYETVSNTFYVNNVDQGSLANDKAYSLLYGKFSGSAGSLVGQQLVINGNVGIGEASPASLLTVGNGDLFQVDTSGYITAPKLSLGYNGTNGQLVIYSEQVGGDHTITFNPHAAMTEDVVYTFPADNGNPTEALTTDGAGNLSWSAVAAAPHAILSATHSDTTAGVPVRGDIITGQGVAPKWTRLAIGGAGTVLSSDGTDVSWSTVGASGITPNSLDYTEFQDTMDLDANLILNQTTYTWTQNFTGTAATGLTYNADSLTSGGALSIASAATAFTGTLANITLSGNNAANTGTLLKVSSTGALNTGVPLMVTNLGAGLSFRVNDETGDADATPFVIDTSGSVGIGTTAPAAQLEIYGAGQQTAALEDAGAVGGTLFLRSSGGSANDGGAILFGAGLDRWAAIKALYVNGVAYGIGDLAFSTRASTGNTALTERMRIKYNGNVGIGTINPTSRLHVVGSNSVATVSVSDLLTADGTFATNNGWTEGAGWTIGAGVATHATGNTATLEGTSTATDDTVVYQINFTVASTEFGDGFTVSLGGQDSGGIYGGNGTETIYIMPSDVSGTLVFTPGPLGTFEGTIDDVTIYAVTSSTPDVLIVNSDGTDSNLEIRAGGNALYNTFIGKDAGKFSTTGDNNSALGVYALNSNTTGHDNSALGTYALHYNTTGQENVALGNGTLELNTTGFENVAVGVHALNSNTSGCDNSALGNHALYTNTTGYENVAVGISALENSTTGYYNSALGAYALQNNGTGIENSAVGYSALSANAGDQNSALGTYALYNNDTGDRNTAVGFYALGNITTGNDNSALGNNAGRYITDGATPNATSGTSVYLGSETKSLADGDSNEIVIGYNATGLGTNTAILGNSSITKTALRGDVGIGTTSPDNLLSLNEAAGDVLLDFDLADADKWVIGLDDSDNDYLKINSGNTLVDASDFIFEDDGDFQLQGDLSVLGGKVTGSNSESISIGETNDNIIFALGGANELTLNTTALYPSTDKGLDLGDATHYWNALYLNGATIYFDDATDATLGYDSSNDELTFNPNGAGDPEMVIESVGEVGIGIVDPSHKLHIVDTSTTDDRAGLYIAQSGAMTNAGYGLYVTKTGASATNVGGYFSSNGATTGYGLQIAALSSATSYGLDIGALSGGTANRAINIGAISGTGTAATITTGAISATGATAYQLNLGAISGANATSHTGINLGNISGATTDAYGINLGTLTGGTTSDTAVNIGAITTTGATNSYGINIAAMAGSGTTTYGINIAAPTATGTSVYGMKIGGPAGAATNNYGLNVTQPTGATHDAALVIGTPATTAGDWALYSASTSHSYFAGEVGIGTVTPNQLLEVAGDTATIRISDSSANRKTQLEFLRGTGGFGSDEYSDWRIYDESGNLKFYVEDTTYSGERFTLLNSGFVGIGTPAPTSRLHVTGSNSVATIGASDLLTATGTFANNNGWTEGAGWTIGAGVATHATGNTATLEGTSDATEDYVVYQVNFTVAVTTAGDGFTVSLGGKDSGTTFTTAGAKTVYVKPNDATGTLVFTPGAAGTFVGTIDDVTIYYVETSTADVKIANSDGTTSDLEIRAGGNGNANIFMGLYAGMNNTTGYENVGIGASALYANTIGYDNTAIGNGTLYANTTGFDNVAVGYLAMQDNTTGIENTVLGAYALRQNLTGEDNTAVGYAALYDNTTGTENTAVGQGALGDNTTGWANAALGNGALRKNTYGDENVAVGYYALGENISGGYYNVAVGYKALGGNTTGDNNIGIGIDAGRFITDGATPNATSGTSVYLGASTKSLADGDANEIVIGYNTTGLGSNTAILGNSSITDTALRGQIGIGTTNPVYQIDARVSDSNAYSATGALTASDMMRLWNEDASADYVSIQLENRAASASIAAIGLEHQANYKGDLFIKLRTGLLTQAEVLRITNAGNVGIGTTAPDAALEINHASGDSLRLTYGDSDGSASNYTDFSLSSTGALTITGSAASVASAAAAEKTFLTVTPATITLTGTTHVTSNMDTYILDRTTIAGNTATVTVDGASTLVVGGPPAEGANVSLTNAAALMVNSAATTADYAYGMFVYAPTGASNNYGAVFYTGAVGVGDATPDFKLDVETDSSADYVANFFNDGNNVDRYGIRIQAGADDGAAVGTTYYLRAYDGNGDETGNLKTVNGTFQLADVSDARLKTNIQDSTLDGLEIIQNLKVRDFHWRSNPTGPVQYGFIAQEAQEAFPYMVHAEEGTGLLTISRDLLIPVIVKGMQELSSSASEQQGEIEALVESNTGQGTSIETLTLKTNENITNLSDLQDSVDEQLAAAATSISNHESRINNLEDQITAQQNLIAELQTQIDELKQLANQELNVAQIGANKNDIDLLKLILGIDRVANAADINLLGSLEAEGIVAGSFTVKITDTEKRTVGQNYIDPIVTDENDDGIDDDTDTDGKSYFVKTTVVNINSRIFVTPKSAIAQPLAVTEIKTGEGFKVEVKIAVSERVYFDWFIVSEQIGSQSEIVAPPAEEPAPVSEEPAPAVEEPTPVVTEPVTTELAPATDEPVSASGEAVPTTTAI